MLETFVLTLWLPACAAALFVLTPEVWQGAPPSLLYLVRAALLGVIGPSGTWAIAERYRKFGLNLVRSFKEQLNMIRQQTVNAVLIVTLLLVTMTTACALAGNATSISESESNEPRVTISSPTANQTFAEGEPVGVVSTAVDAEGIVRVELWADGQLVHTSANPQGPQANAPYLANQSWTPDKPGHHVLEVRAYNPANVVGKSEQVYVEVMTPQATDTPTPPEQQMAAEPTPTAPPPTNTPTPESPPETAVPCSNASQFIADVTIPDGTVLQPGEQFDKVWRVKNSGTCPWTSGYRFVFVEGESFNGSTSVSLSGEVPPGAEFEFQLTLTAPTAPGQHLGAWELYDPQGVPFGNRYWVTIEVEVPWVVVREGSVALYVNNYFDLYRGSITNPGDGHIAALSSDGVFLDLQAINGSIFGMPTDNREPDLNECRNRAEGNYTADRATGEADWTDNYICVKLNNNAISRVYIRQSTSTAKLNLVEKFIEIEYRTWKQK